MKLKNFQDVYSLDEIADQVDASFPFDHFFSGQRETIIRVVDAFLNSGKRHVILEAPTGSGKTIIAWTVHRVLDKLIGNERLKTTVSTTTKGLQKQYVEDCGTYNLMGKTNYPCAKGCKHYSTVECKHKVAQKQCKPAVECPYVKQRLTWTETMHWRSTNSAMLVEMCPMLCMMPDNKADLIVVDECHKMKDTLIDHTRVGFAPDQLKAVSAFNGGQHVVQILADLVVGSLRNTYTKKNVGELVTLDLDKLVTINPSQYSETVRETLMENDIVGPRESLFKLVNALNIELNAFLEKITLILKRNETLDPSIKDACDRVILNCQDWSDTCEILTDCGVRDFILQEYTDKTIEFTPLLASDVSYYGLFRKADYFLHMSATICGLDAYANEIGIPKDDYTTVVAPHPIDLERRQINYLPQIKMSGGFSPDKAKQMAKHVAELAQHHSGENGLVHTASYQLAEAIISYLPAHLKTQCFVGRDREKTMTNLKLNKGVICFSPSMEEGYDLKHDLARWQVIAKVPFGYLGDPSIKYRAEKVSGSYTRDTVLRVVQACGRVVRGADDNGITYILDSGFDRLFSQGDHFFPTWWKDALNCYE